MRKLFYMALIAIISCSLCYADNKVIDRYEEGLNNGYTCVVEGIKTNDEINFGGYELIRVNLLKDNRVVSSREIKDLIGLKLDQVKILVSLGDHSLGGCSILVQYRYTDCEATPRDWFVTAALYGITNSGLQPEWVYNIEEETEDGGYKCLIDFDDIDKDGEEEIVVVKRFSGSSICREEFFDFRNGIFVKIKESKLIASK